MKNQKQLLAEVAELKGAKIEIRALNARVKELEATVRSLKSQRGRGSGGRGGPGRGPRRPGAAGGDGGSADSLRSSAENKWMAIEKQYRRGHVAEAFHAAAKATSDELLVRLALKDVPCLHVLEPEVALLVLRRLVNIMHSSEKSLTVDVIFPWLEQAASFGLPQKLSTSERYHTAQLLFETMAEPTDHGVQAARLYPFYADNRGPLEGECSDGAGTRQRVRR